MVADWEILDPGAGDLRFREELARLLWERLEAPLNHDRLINGFYLPLFIHLYEQLQKAGDRPLVVGINAPQGGGKTTLTHYLVQLFEACNRVAVSLSIDDFYLTHRDQIRLAEAYPGNPYLQQRGYPGTHDLNLGIETLTGLKNPSPGKRLGLPRYDKSMHQGQGDRQPHASWPQVEMPVDVVLLEGWMLGFEPIEPERIEDPQLQQTNTLLIGYRAWHEFLDSFVYIQPLDPDLVINWRCEAEERMKARGLPGMSVEQVRTYAEKFLPAYRLYGTELLNRPPVPDACLRIMIGEDRLPID